MPPTWSVVATVDEPAPLVVAFVLHHLESGAQEVALFLDGPNPEAQDHLSGIKQARVVLCDEAHWAASPRRRRPKLHPGRQLTNANIAYGQTRADWLLHCDCDEFVRDGAALAQELDGMADKHLYLRLQVAERVYLGPATDDLFEGGFRSALEDFAAIGPSIYGSLAPFLKDGLTGHRAGKGVVRTGLPLVMGIHSPEGRPPHKSARTPLVHFDGLTRLHYVIKLLRRAHEPPTQAPPRHGAPRIEQFGQMRALVDQPGQARDLVESLKSLTKTQQEALRALDALDRRPFRPLGRNPMADDLTVTAMDRALRARHHDFLQAHAPGFLAP